MANTDSTLCNTQSNLLKAIDKLDEAKAVAHFVQSIGVNGRRDDSLTLQPSQLTGFYYVMQNAIDLIKEAEALIDTARAQPEAFVVETHSA